METLIAEFKDWVSDPVVAGLLGFFLTGLFLKIVSRFFRVSGKG